MVDPFGIGDGIDIEQRLKPLPKRLREMDIYVRGFTVNTRLGAVCVPLRMSAMTMNSGDDYRRLLIWEMNNNNNNNNNNSWVLVHEAALETESLFFALAFHPSDNNVIFLVRGREVFRYNIVKDKYERVSKFPATNGCEFNEESVAKYLNVLTIVHPTWQTPLTFVLQTVGDEIIS